jgi:hypothetical protein
MNYSSFAYHDLRHIFSKCLLIFKANGNGVFDLGAVMLELAFVWSRWSSGIRVKGFSDSARTGDCCEVRNGSLRRSKSAWHFLSDSVLLEASPGTCCFSDQMEEEMRGGPVTPGEVYHAYLRIHYFIWQLTLSLPAAVAPRACARACVCVCVWAV